MSVGEWLTVVGLLITCAIFGGTIVVGVIGWFITRMINKLETKVDGNIVAIWRLSERLTRIETVLADRGIMAHKAIKFPSPPMINGEESP